MEENIKLNPLVKSFLIITLFGYFLLTVFFFVLGDILINYSGIDPSAESLTLYSILSILSFISFIFTMVLMAKKKLGFWGLTATSVIAIYYIVKISAIYALIPLLIILIIFGFLQTKTGEGKTWNILK